MIAAGGPNLGNHFMGYKLFLLPYMNGGARIVNLDPATGGVVQEVYAGMVTAGQPITNPSGLLGNLNALRCPSNPYRLVAANDRTTPVSYGSNGGSGLYITSASGTKYCRTPFEGVASNGYDQNAGYRRLDQVTRPSAMWVISENFSRNNIVQWDAVSNLIIFLGHGGSSANFSFADGHVSQMKPSQTYSSTTNMWAMDHDAPTLTATIQGMIANETYQASLW